MENCVLNHGKWDVNRFGSYICQPHVRSKQVQHPVSSTTYLLCHRNLCVTVNTKKKQIDRFGLDHPYFGRYCRLLNDVINWTQISNQ